MSLERELRQAVQSRKLGEVERLLAAGADPNAGLEVVDPRADSLRCALIEGGANAPELLSSLAWAAGVGRPETVRCLLALGADKNQASFSGTPLEIAAQCGHLEVVRLLWEAGADRQPNPLPRALLGKQPQVALWLLAHGCPPEGLVGAAARGLTEVVAALLALGLKVDERADSMVGMRLRDFTALHIACHQGHWETVECLLQAGADPHLRESRGLDCLELATTEVAEKLKQRGLQSRLSPAEALLLAAEQGDLQGVLRAEAPVDSADSRLATRGRTALALAAWRGHREVVEALLAAGADVHRRDGEVADPRIKQLYVFLGEEMVERPLGRTALHWACRAGQGDCVRALLAAGADGTAPDFVGLTPLRLAAPHESAVRALLEAGVAADAKGLTKALEEGGVGAARAMLAAGAKASQKAFVEAAGLADLELLRAFPKVKMGAAVAALVMATRRVPSGEAPPGNWTRINSECVVPQPEERILACLESLLERGADVHAAGPLGPPLLCAARQGLRRVLERLLEAGADPKTQHGGDTALSLARLYGHGEIEAFLLGRGAAEPRPVTRGSKRTPGPELARPQLQATPAFLEVVAELEKRCGYPAIAKEYLCGGMEIHGRLDVLALQREFRPRGVFVFEPQQDTLAVLPTEEWSVALAVMQTNGANCDLAPSDVLEWMRELEKRQPFELQVVRHDTLAGRFLTPIADPKGLAEEMYRFCPDIVDQGCGTTAALARELRKQPAQLYFWWD